MTRPSRRLTALALTAVLGLAAAGCGSDDEDSGTAAPAASTPAASTPAAAPAAAAGDEVQVGMKNIAFEPKEITVKVGQKITWTNNEPIDHNVVANGGADFESEIFGEGGTFSYTPDKAGKITYDCTLHPGMDGTITVQ